jgi:hypothetical protein
MAQALRISPWNVAAWWVVIPPPPLATKPAITAVRTEDESPPGLRQADAVTPPKLRRPKSAQRKKAEDMGSA